ncbi:c-type cytochrome biogenesis protein CcmI [Rhodoligotrophos defluvii]|uniref:c-type cytochrome biogenesis protein CcmI n=1 Tax=Rhodoligotrophos defluvii TaxID=2561934 RepID=UPI0010C9B804|nr:c-type cytochrome biogenesis protein CcmI [Rhodoligotrophos defluvii]
MGLWIILAALTALAIAAVIWPLVAARKGRQPAMSQDAAVYRDQLAELDRERARGQIGEKEAEAARNEIARRLIAATKAGTADAAGAGAREPKPVILAALIGIPALSLAVYLALGQPLMPGVPHAERMAHALENQDYPALIAQVEERLAAKPDDVQGWRVLAPIYVRQGRYADAAKAYGRIMMLEGERPDLLASYAEALILANGGLVSEQARQAVDRALALDAKLPKARFYKGLAAKQDGDTAQALSIWRALLKDAPADAPWRSVVETNVAALAGTPAAPALSQDQVEAVTSQGPAAQQQMIRGMVEGLQARLDRDGGPVDDWLKLARARVVLGENDAARAVLTKAAEQFRGDNAALARIDEARRVLHLTD